MFILGVDYGRKKIGLAIAEASLAEPLGVVNSLAEVKKIIQTKNIEKVVVGVSEGRSAKEAKEFGRKLQQESGLKIVFQDETLSTHEAQTFSQAAGMKRKKRRQLEDAFAATLILQSYLDNL